jgi:probable F420-dependent oxidoreductase
MEIGFLHIATAISGDLAALARRAEDIGYDSLWIPEHPVIPIERKTPYLLGGDLPEHYGRWTDPFIALSMAAAVTTRLKLATGICLLPERETLVTAKTIASLDLYSRGRVMLGIGAGWLREETELFGADFLTRWQRMREMTEAMRVLWTEDAPRYSGKQIRFPAVRCEPKPHQPGGPPFLLGGHGEKALQRVARSYDGWCPIVMDAESFAREAAELKEMMRAQGRDPSRLILSPFVDPQDGKLPDSELRAYKAAGAARIVLFSIAMSEEIANGAGPEWLEKGADIVRRARET